MGKGLAFLQLKFWHPGNKNNIQKKWEKEQEEKYAQQREEERRMQLKHEKEVLQNKQMIVAMGGKDAEHYRSELKKAPVAWMYKAPPGLKDLEAKSKESQDAKDKEAAFQKSLEGLTRDQKRKAEREFEEMLTERERQLRRFSFLQNAPVQHERVHQTTAQLNHKPFGIQVKNVRCFKCGMWGHRVGDGECPKASNNPLAPIHLQTGKGRTDLFDKRQTTETQVLDQETIEADANRVELTALDKAHGGYDASHFTQQMVSDDDSSSDEADPMKMAKNMSVDQLKALINKVDSERKKKKKKKKSKKKKKKKKRRHSSDSDDSDDDRNRRKKKKSKKKKRKRMDSDSDSEDHRRKKKRRRQRRHDNTSVLNILFGFVLCTILQKSGGMNHCMALPASEIGGITNNCNGGQEHVDIGSGTHNYIRNMNLVSNNPNNIVENEDTEL